MKKLALSILAGTTIGIIDIIPMIIKQLPQIEIASAFSLWVIVAYFIYYSNLPLKGALKGIAISIPIWIPVSFLVFPQGMAIIIIITVTNLVLGSILGFAIERIKRK